MGIGIGLIGLWVGGFFGGMSLGFSIGKYAERIKWDELIDKGVIPKPKKR